MTPEEKIRARAQKWANAPHDAMIPFHLAADAILYDLGDIEDPDDVDTL